MVAVLDAWILGCLAFTLAHRHAKPLSSYGGNMHISESPYMNPGSIYKGRIKKCNGAGQKDYSYIITFKDSKWKSINIMICLYFRWWNKWWIHWRFSIPRRLTKIAQHVTWSTCRYDATSFCWRWTSSWSWVSSATSSFHAGKLKNNDLITFQL